MIFPILLIMGILYGVFESGDISTFFKIQRSTIQREVLPSDKCKAIDKWYQDDWGDWIDKSGEPEAVKYGLEYFYKKTGIHNAFQVACTLPHGTSLGTIRSLIKYNLAAGNATLARKYADILARNPVNRATARAARRIADRMDGTTNLDAGPSDSAATITHNTLYNMKSMAREGLFDIAAADRTRCLLMLQRDLRSFLGTFPEDED